MKARVIAFYLPQYYPTDLNDKWYGKGFTEWTNVGKARPLFPNHYQPRVPADLGYYDLRNPEIRLKQAEYAQESGIEGFCYYHYWFGEGHEELDIPFKNVVKTGTPALPFCLCWANQSWYSKFWKHDIKCEAKLIVEQKYDNEIWTKNHFLSLLDAFRDTRYITVDGKLLFMIYRPLEYPEIKIFMNHWQSLAREYNLPPFYFIGQATSETEAQRIIETGLDGVNLSRKDDFLSTNINGPIHKIKHKIARSLGFAYYFDYSEIVDTFIKKDGIESQENIYPTLIPNWDHSPRSGRQALIMHNSTPDLFQQHLSKAIDVIKNKKDEHKIIFLKSWNEWGEGNYVEPDLKYGTAYLNVIKNF